MRPRRLSILNIVAIALNVVAIWRALATNNVSVITVANAIAVVVLVFIMVHLWSRR